MNRRYWSKAIQRKCGPATVIGALLTNVFVIACPAQPARNALHVRHEPLPGVARVFTAPTNLKVLPSKLTGAQVQTIMEQWNAELGVRCEACHRKEPEEVAAEGLRRARFADDSKPMKKIARFMYTMTVEINRKFIVGDDSVPGPITCGTCHRGRISPEPFVSRTDAHAGLIQDPASEEMLVPKAVP